MSIANEISRIQTAKQNIKAAIEAKGGTVTGTIETFATAITNLSVGSGGGNDYVVIPQSNSILPDDYTQLDYIEADGNQYIQTSIKMNANTYFDYKILITNINGNTHTNGMKGMKHLFSGVAYRAPYSSSETGRLALKRGGKDYLLDSVFSQDVIYNVKTSGNSVFVNNNEVLTNCVDNGTSENTYATFFAYGGEPSNTVYRFFGRVYYFKIYTNDTLSYNFIPAKRQSDNAIGLYDIVNGQFYKSATSTSLIAGTETQITTTYIEDATFSQIKSDIRTAITSKGYDASNSNWSDFATIISRLGNYVAPLLPDGYTQYDYLKGNGESYIITDYVPTTNTQMEISFYFVSSDKFTQIAGSQKEYCKDSLFVCTTATNGQIRFDVSNKVITYTNTSLLNSVVNVKMNYSSPSTILINGSNVTTNLLSSSTNTGQRFPIYIFDICVCGEALSITNTNDEAFTGKIYSLKLYESNVLSANFVPCTNPSGVAGMYETVGKQFYSSANDTPFTVGND